MLASGVRFRVNLRAMASITNVYPANHRAVNRIDNPALQAGIRHDRAAEKPEANAGAKATPAPVVSAPAAVAPAAVAPGRRGSGRKRNCAKSDGRGENKSYLAEQSD